MTSFAACFTAQNVVVVESHHQNLQTANDDHVVVLGREGMLLVKKKKFQLNGKCLTLKLSFWVELL